MIRGLESRISRLEQYRKPRCCYVINCSDPPTADELPEISRRVARLPRAKRETDGFAAFPSGILKRPEEMTDAELIHAILGVRT
jgi:hypothetical protein